VFDTCPKCILQVSALYVLNTDHQIHFEESVFFKLVIHEQMIYKFKEVHLQTHCLP